MSKMNASHQNDKSPSNTLMSSLQSQKYERTARESLRDLVVLNEMLEGEIQRMKMLAKQGISIDQIMMGKMNSVRDKYISVMEGMRTIDSIAARHELIIYADAVQDLMKYVQQRRH